MASGDLLSDTDSIVRVTQWFKEFQNIDPVTRQKTTYQIDLDFGIGVVDFANNGVYIYGSPYQVFTNIGAGGIYGDPNADTRVLVQRERMTSSLLPATTQVFPGDVVHFKNPNI